jgi:hypothetical protein
MRKEELQLRHPAERPLFIAYAVLNVVLIVAPISMIARGSAWLHAHPQLEKYRGRIRVLAIAAVAGVPGTVFLRNTRHAETRGKSIAISPQQLPQLYAILRRHCEKIQMESLPELYFSDMSIPKPARASRSWKCNYIVLSSKFLQPSLEPMLPVLAFWLGREIGCLRLNHATWTTEFLLAYVDKVPYLSGPLRRVFTYSEDRYGAFLAPEGLQGLIGVASGRIMLGEVNVPDYLNQARVYGGVWAQLATLTEKEPTLARRIQALPDAGLLKPDLAVKAATRTGNA